jgi:threonine synthase
MVTAEGSNSVIGVKADFDFCQNTVKDIFNDEEFKKILKDKFSVSLTSANSINWGRLLPQIVYTFHAYLELVKVSENC